MRGLGLAVYGIRVVEILLYLAAADLRGTRQVNYFNAFFSEEVELAFPVVSDHESVDVVFMHVTFLLFPVFFRDNQIHISDGLNKSLALFVGEIAFLLLGIPVEFIS